MLPCVGSGLIFILHSSPRPRHRPSLPIYVQVNSDMTAILCLYSMCKNSYFVYSHHAHVLAFTLCCVSQPPSVGLPVRVPRRLDRQPVDTRGLSHLSREPREVYFTLCPWLESAPCATPPSPRAPEHPRLWPRTAHSARADRKDAARVMNGGCAVTVRPRGDDEHQRRWQARDERE